MKTKVFDALVKVSVPSNWDKMTKEQQLKYIQERQDNHLLVSIVKIK